MVPRVGNPTGGGMSPQVVQQPDEETVFAALRTFLTEVLPAGTTVLQARQNRTPPPRGMLVLMAPLHRQPIGTGSTRYGAQSCTLLRQEQLATQISLFGTDAADAAQTLLTLWRDAWSTTFFTNLVAQQQDMPRIAPLYADNAECLPYINAQQQYEPHWQLTLHSQLTFSITLPAATATTATVHSVAADRL
ncbi:Hypothetical protein APO_2017 [Acetobacter pomorum DM001]|uniref:Phage neck terminator protein gp12-like domain-containing protein n=2 Tax=Acetobacteraceae TaxID=433 RepID=F1YVM7_9PROT|nr:hypothetical protein [Acetobacter pomorum]AXC25806.1 hypothetical protein DS739_02735 [Acetobacter sp. JWB]EGE47332.1 Hypothetical protein APO_2017 [Acetobacter pomorum DM001]ATI11818.1 hypothetical protein CPF11_04695 [Acetobacter pomorum]KAA8427176.1 hypothetical protein FKW54_04335 [Acetobacter pomorum]KAA8432678.1 hypothetical protein FKW50_09380 [Acetobacter pomorum]